MCNVLCNCEEAQQFRYITCPATKAYLCIFTDGSAYVSSDTRLPFLNKQLRSENSVLGDRESSTDTTSKPSYSSRSDIDKPRGQNAKPFIENDFPKQITRAFRGHEPFRAHRGKTPFGPTHPTELTRCLEYVTWHFVWELRGPVVPICSIRLHIQPCQEEPSVERLFFVSAKEGPQPADDSPWLPVFPLAQARSSNLTYIRKKAMGWNNQQV